MSYIKFFSKLLHKHMIVAQSLQAGVLMGTGDLIAQTCIERKRLKNLDYRRTGQFFILGSCLVGPAVSTWYRFLSRKIVAHPGSSSVVVVLKKVAADQLLFAPSFLVIFLVAINTIRGENWALTKEEIRLKYKDILLANYKLWPAAQLVNFYFMPLRHQVLFAQTVALIWNCYISWKTYQRIDVDDK